MLFEDLESGIKLETSVLNFSEWPRKSSCSCAMKCDCEQAFFWPDEYGWKIYLFYVGL